MSTNPPTAVMTPRVSSSSFKLHLDRSQSLRATLQNRGRRRGRKAKAALDHQGGGRSRAGEALEVGAELLPRRLAHSIDIAGLQPCADSDLVDQRPFGEQ